MAQGRMTQWRDSQRRKAAGMAEISTWVPLRAKRLLKDAFGRLADPGERGDSYRLAALRWMSRRRVVEDCYRGVEFTAEIDAPQVGTHWYSRPIGGRVIGSLPRTWVELTPDQAEEVGDLCRRAVSDALATWVDQQGLRGRVIDKVGVALDPPFAMPDYGVRDGDIVFRPQSDDEFEKSEVEIAQQVRDDALRSRVHPTQNPNVAYYPGLDGVPSRCYVVHRRFGSKVLFALGYIRHGGTSPTNMIEELTRRFHKQFYPDVKFDDIEWYDCWLSPVEPIEYLDISRVRLLGEDGEPEWDRNVEIPADFRSEIEACYARDRADVGNASVFDIASLLGITQGSPSA